MENNTKRLDYFDIAKGISIISIVLGHMGISFVNRIVFTFHVPIFFLISGFFMSKYDDIKSFFKKRCKQLLVPYYLTSIVLILLPCLKNIIKGEYNLILKTFITKIIECIYASGTNNNKTIMGIGLIGAIWFLWALLWAQLITKFLIDKKYSYLWILLVFIISYISSKFVWLPTNIQAGGTACVFVYIGVLAKKYKEKLFEVNKFTVLLTIFGFVVLIAEALCLNIALSVVSNYYPYIPLTIIGSIFISYSVIMISKVFEKTKVCKNILLFYGRNSLSVLCLHLIELNNAPWTKLIQITFGDVNKYINVILLVVMKFLFITIGVIFINEFKKLINNRNKQNNLQIS